MHRDRRLIDFVDSRLQSPYWFVVFALVCALIGHFLLAS